MDNGGDLDFYKVPLSSLTYEAHNLLSCLLNTSKTLLSDGPEKLPRDWRGLARLVNISTEIANSYERDKTAKVIQYWTSKRDGTATVGKLLDYVQKIDRYDIFDDLMALAEEARLIVNQPLRGPPCNIVATPMGNQLVPYEEDPEENIITFDDKIHGAPQFYHAYVMYAIQDKDFVDEMLIRMREKGFKLCIEDDLLPDHTTPYAPVSRLISSDRCHRIILVYSPDFLTSPANNFYTDYAQAVGIEMKKPKIIPCLYRPCQLPQQVRFYHKLYYTSPGSRSSYDFWDRLALSLDVRDTAHPRINGLNSTAFSALNITELSTTSSSNLLHQGLLALPSPPTKSSSINDLDSYMFNSNTTMSLEGRKADKKKKEKSRLKNMLDSLKFKKKKEVKIHA